MKQEARSVFPSVEHYILCVLFQFPSFCQFFLCQCSLHFACISSTAIAIKESVHVGDKTQKRLARGVDDLGNSRTHTHRLPQHIVYMYLVECSPRLQSVVGSNPTQGSSSSFLGKKAISGVVDLFVVPCQFLRVL